MITKRVYEIRLRRAEQDLRKRFNMSQEATEKTALVLDTVWSDSFNSERKPFMNLSEFPNGKDLEEMEGRERRIELETIDGKPVLILRGCVCMNECTFNPYAAVFVRMQIELLLRLGVKNLILTCTANGIDVHSKTIVFVDSFVSDFNETMPLFPNECCFPEEVLDRTWIDQIDESSYRPMDCLLGAYVYWRGPHAEGSLFDLENMKNRFGLISGMRIKPECCIAALYPNVRVLALAYVANRTDDISEQTAHEKNKKTEAKRLSQFLTDVVKNI